MDGIHDLGGMDGFGAVAATPGEPAFPSPWEARVFGTTMATMITGSFNTPQFRHAIERMAPAHYLRSSYYEHWLTAVATLTSEAGVLDPEELAAKAGVPFPLSGPVSSRAGEIGLDPPAGGGGGADPRFAVGDRVRVREMHPFGHTRCPRYVRGHLGTVAAVEGAFPVPEIEAHRREIVVEATYAVRFEAAELWGAAAEPAACVHVDLYERWLEDA